MNKEWNVPTYSEGRHDLVGVADHEATVLRRQLTGLRKYNEWCGMSYDFESNGDCSGT